MTQTSEESTAAEGGNRGNRAEEMAQEMKDEVRGKGQELKGRVAEKADMATSRVGRKIESVSRAMRERAPEDSRMHGAASAVADRLERAGSYLQESDVGTMTGDLSAMVRRHPVRSVLVGVSLGYLMGRLMGRKR